MKRLYENNNYTGLELAVIGLDCKFPQAHNPKKFWENLKHGIEGISFFSELEMMQSGIEPSLYKDPNYVPAKGILENVENFDPHFFNYTSREITMLDPQVRIFHECVSNALENAGYNPETYTGQIGLYAGSTMGLNWILRQMLMNEQPTFNTNFREYLCTTVSYKLRLTGPCVTVLTACSTSLVAVHMACQALLNGECNIAIAGGVNISLPLKKGYYYTDDLIYSPDGHCRTFDASSKGTLVSDGAGVVVLKNLQDAISDGDNIYAVIKGSAINNDGNRKVGFSAPSINGQKEVIETALHMAEVEPESITMLEAHGTGTKVGDTIEIEALKRAYKTDKKEYCAIGSVKSNLGHLNEAAGIAGLIKTILAIKYRQIPQTINFMNPNQKIEFEDSPFYVNDSLTDWKSDDFPLRAGVSSFGIGGTNVHAILEEPPLIEKSEASNMSKLFVVSAKTETALEEQCSQLENYLLDNRNINLDDVAYTLQVGRIAHQYRSCFVINEFKEIINGLKSKSFQVRCAGKNEYSVLYVLLDLTGSAEIVELAGLLYRNNKLFQSEIDHCVRELNHIRKFDFTFKLAEKMGMHDRKAIHFLFEYALVKVLLKLNSKSLGFLGLGTGNFVAAALSGAVTLEDMFLTFINKDIVNINSNHICQPKIPLFSSITGNKVLAEDMFDTVFWQGMFENSPYPSGGIKKLLNTPNTIVAFLDSEIGEQGIFKEINSIAKDVVGLSQCMVAVGKDSCFLKLIGELWSLGLVINWKMLSEYQNYKRVPLPTYPFERNRYFLDEDPMTIGLDLLKQNQAEVRKNDMSQWFYQPSWKRLSLENDIPSDRSRPSTALFFDTDISGLLNEYYRGCVRKPKLIARGDGIGQQADIDYMIDNYNKESYSNLFIKFLKDTGSYPETILYFNLLQNDFNEDDHVQWDNYLKETLFSLLYLVQAIDDLNVKNPLKLIVVANGIVDVIGSEEINPIKASLLGLLRNIPIEYPDIKCKLIDITGQEHLMAKGLLDRLAKEIDEETEEDVVAYRGKYKWLPIFEPLQIRHNADLKPALKENGVYLITGGTGGIGLELADFIAKNCKAKIILIGSSYFPPKKQWDNWLKAHAVSDRVSSRIRKIKDIEQKGAEVSVFQTDVSIFIDFKETMDQVQKEFGDITGVIHGAGLPGGGLIQNKDWETAYKVLAPKIHGAIYLNQIIRNNSLQFFIVCSSISTVFPIVGQSDYNAANAFLDAYALYSRNSGGRSITSIKWDIWKDVGMAVKSDLTTQTKKYIRKPLVDYYVSKNGKDIYCLELNSKKHWVLQDHRTEEYGVLSGTALLEMVREAVENSNIARPFIIQDIQFILPITIEETKEKEVCLIVQAIDGVHSFSVYSRVNKAGNSWLLHAAGRISRNTSKPSKTNISELKELCGNQDVVFDEAKNRRHAGHLIFGKRWLNIKRVMAGDDQGLAIIELSEEYKADLEDYQLHPGLLDSATSFLLGFINKTNLYIPLSYERLEIYGGLPQRFYSYCKYLNHHIYQDDLVSFDILIMDEQGNVLLNIKNYTMIAISDSITSQIEKGKKQALPVILDEITDTDSSDNANIGQEGILSTEGQEIFGRTIVSDTSSILISSIDIRKRSEKVRARNTDKGLDTKPLGRSITKSKRMGMTAEYEPPVTDTEKKLVDIYENLFGISPVGIEDDIFEIGVDSLKAIHLSSQIRKAFSISLKLTDVFNHKTIKNIAEFIDNDNGKVFTGILPVGLKSYYKTSFSQKRMFFLQGLLDNSIAYNESTAFLLEGPVEFKKIEETFIKIIDRHESLRTSFKIIDNEIVQIVHANVDFKLIYLKSSNAKLEEEIEKFNKPFDLDNAPLLRVALIKVDSQKYVLILDIHHIISDGTSINLIINDFAKMYMGDSLPPLKIQYKDFAEWQNSFMELQQYKVQETFWLDTLGGSLPVLNLPYDYPRPANLSFNGALFQLKIDLQLSNAIKDFSRDNDVTGFMTLLAAYYVLLSRLSREEDILIGVPQSGRQNNDVKDIVGMFVNTVVLRNRPQSEKSFITFLREVKENLLQALENQDFQIEMIIDKLDFKRDPGRTLLYDTIFNYQSMKNQADSKEIHLGGIGLLPYPNTTKTTRADINIHLYEVDNCIYLDCFYRTDLFKRETIQYIVGEYQNLLSQITKNSNHTLKQYRIFQQKSITNRGNRVLPQLEFQPLDYKYNFENVVSRFEKQVSKYPGKTAIKDGSNAWDYCHLNEKANRIAKRIVEQTGSVPGCKTVALLFENKIEMIAGLMGALKSGIPFVPLDRSVPIERIAYMINDSQSKIMVTNSENLPLAYDIIKDSKIDVRIINSDESLDNYSGENLGMPIEKEKTVFILYTSGSTGYPKGVIQTHKNLYFYLSQFTRELCINSEDRIPLLTPYCHAIGMLDILSSLLNGCTLQLYDFKLDGNMSRFANWLNSERITIFHSVPSIFRFFMKNLNEYIPLPYLRMIILGGEVVTKTDFDFYKENCSDNSLFVNFLGCSELMVISFFILNKQVDIKNTSIPTGYLVEDIKLMVMDEPDKEAGILEVGELFYSSEYISPGYLNNSDITQKTFLKNTVFGEDVVYRSGDYGKLLPDGCLEYYGRKDSQVKIRGFRVDLNEIETVIDNLVYVKKSVAKAIKNENSDYTIAVYYVLKQSVTQNEIISILKEKLPSYLIPQYWMELKSFPMTGTNKIDRSALPQLELGRASFSECISPQNETEKMLLDIWSEVLDMENIGIDDGFFQLGGHSLKLMQVQNNLEKKLGVKIEMADLFKYPTIRSLVSFLKDNRKINAYLEQSKQRGEMRKDLIKQRRN